MDFFEIIGLILLILAGGVIGLIALFIIVITVILWFDWLSHRKTHSWDDRYDVGWRVDPYKVMEQEQLKEQKKIKGIRRRHRIPKNIPDEWIKELEKS